jgi:hypothetical protein
VSLDRPTYVGFPVRKLDDPVVMHRMIYAMDHPFVAAKALVTNSCSWSRGLTSMVECTDLTGHWLAWEPPVSTAFLDVEEDKEAAVPMPALSHVVLTRL